MFYQNDFFFHTHTFIIVYDLHLYVANKKRNQNIKMKPENGTKRKFVHFIYNEIYAHFGSQETENWPLNGKKKTNKTLPEKKKDIKYMEN